MSPIALVCVAFVACLVLIGLAGPKLAWSGDIIAEKTGLSGNWIGLILIATVTSLPELATGVSAVTIAGEPDIAVGDVFGSCVFNLALLVVLDFIQRGESVYRRVRQGHILSAAFGVVMIAFAGMSLLLHGHGASIAIGGIGSYTPIIFGLYALGVRAVFSYERAQRVAAEERVESRHPGVSLRRAGWTYAAAGAVVVAAGTVLPFVAGELAAVTGWQRSFVGTLLVAAVTSLPEAVVCLAAVRLGVLDMAVANLLGSNLFNILILGIDDLFSRGPLFERVSPVHAVSTRSAVLVSGIVIAGIVYRPQHRLFRTVGWISLGLFTVYLLNAYFLYLHGA
ncbi:MAG: sodium:calcium antiporter [Rhodospirillales bacterium]|nr:sodium:calcium antiporter [Rhodospirillales bacterium]